MLAVLIIVAVVVTVTSIICLSLVTGMGLFVSSKSSVKADKADKTGSTANSDKTVSTNDNNKATGGNNGGSNANSGAGSGGSSAAGGGSSSTRTPATYTAAPITGGASIDLKAASTSTSISVVPVSDRQLLGAFADIKAKCAAPNYTPKQERIENASKVMYANNKIRLAYNLPLPTYEQSINKKTVKKQLTETNIQTMLCMLDELYVRMCVDMATDECKRREPVNMFIMDNQADAAKTPIRPAGALSGVSRIIWNPSSFEGTELGLLAIATHEMTHVIAAHANDSKWGAGIAEGLANFMANYYLPGDTNAYWTPGFMYSNEKQLRYMNPYSKEAMDYNATLIRAYNSSFWWFMHGRYGGIESIKNFFNRQAIKTMTAQNVPFWMGMAQHLGVSASALAAYWLGDLLTLAWFRKDPMRYTLARKYVNKNVISQEVLVFKQFDNGSLSKSVTSNGLSFAGKATSFKLEAFGFAAYDLNAICFGDMKLQSGAKISIRVTSLPAAADDGSTWVMALVTGPEAVQYVTGNTVTVGPIPSTKPFVLGVMHTKMSLMSGNSVGSSAINHQIEVSNAA